MLEDVKKRLSSLGVSISSETSNSDEVLLTFAIDRVTNFINNQTNLLSVPNELNEVAVDKVCSEFLFVKKSMNQLFIESLNFDSVAKEVQDGDTNVVFAINEKTTPEAKFEAFLIYLQHNNVNYGRYRVLVW